MRKDVVIAILIVLVSLGDFRYIPRGSHPYWKHLLNFNADDESAEIFKRKLYRQDEIDKREERARQAKELPQNGELFEEDMVMDDRLRDIVLDEGRKRSASVFRKLKWKFNVEVQGVVIPYTVDKNFEHPALLKEAIQEYKTRTCIRFQERVNEEGYVHFNSDKNTCSSNVGRVGRKQNVTIGTNCNVIGTVLHEMEHVLAVIHEHSRPDRDEYVKVLWKNIKKADELNFKKYKTNQVQNDVAYNFNSVMHYRNDAFTKNQEDTLIAKDNPTLEFGQRDQWSKGDVLTINKLYCIHDDVKNDYSERNYELYQGLLHDTSGNKQKDREQEELWLDAIKGEDNEESALIIPAWE